MSKAVGDIFLAAREGRHNLVTKLLDQGAPVNGYRWSGVTLLHRCAETTQTELVKILIERGADVNQKTTWGWQTPLHYAARVGAEEICLDLIQAGANWNVTDKHGRTPYRLACDNGFAFMAKK
mmetsp:Transcript_19929/g.60344  ORF Transcript_19929/g.60344 Transcript_19929/m.60344 type:complete len:123 (-) Transcript_19929:666-1034(-)